MTLTATNSGLPSQPLIIHVTDAERACILASSRSLVRRFGNIDNPLFLNFLSVEAHDCLPLRIRRLLAEFRHAFQSSDYGSIVLRNFIAVDQDALGDTPPRWQEAEADRSKVLCYEFASALVHGAIGADPIQMQYQRSGGGYCHSIIADPAWADKQVSAGNVKLIVHTEDSALSRRADFISFLYLRNFEKVRSPFASIRSLDLSEAAYEPVLWLNDIIHPSDENTDKTEDAAGNFRLGPVLYGNPVNPFCVQDFVEMLRKSVPQKPEVRAALEALQAALDETVFTFIPEAGDMAIVNNRIVFHGRNSYMPGFFIPEGSEGKDKRHLWQPVPKRWMIRCMSVVSLADIYEGTHPENPRLFLEDPTRGVTSKRLAEIIAANGYTNIRSLAALHVAVQSSHPTMKAL